MATHAGLLRLAADFATPAGVQCQILRQGAEETRLPPSSVDVAFTSPPYFNLELYADGEPSQSHVKYPTPSWWVEQFLQVRACVRVCVLGLSGVLLSASPELSTRTRTLTLITLTLIPLTFTLIQSPSSAYSAMCLRPSNPAAFSYST